MKKLFYSVILSLLFANIFTASAQDEKLNDERQTLIRFLGDMPERPPLNVDTLEKVRIDKGWRYKIKYLSEPADSLFNMPEDWIYAYLFIPDNHEKKKLPAIVAIHQDDINFHIGKSEPAGLMGDSTMFYGLELFNRGYVVICPDRYYHAERRLLSKNKSYNPNEIDPERDFFLQSYQVGILFLKGRTHYSKEAYDLSRAVDLLYTLSYVDKEKIGTVGHSAGGLAMTYFMFYDTRVKLGVSSCGIFDINRAFNFTYPQPMPSEFAIPNLAKSGYSSFDYVKHIAPRSLLLTRGKYEWGKNDKGSIALVDEIEKFKTEYLDFDRNGDIKIIIFEDGGGHHSFPYAVRQEVYRWIDERLK